MSVCVCLCTVCVCLCVYGIRPKVGGTIQSIDEKTEGGIVTWYLVQTSRATDGVATQVHRRFRDFVELHSQVKANLKGNHLFQALPTLPEKPLKVLTDHNDPNFIEERRRKLEIYLVTLVNIPHVQDMVCIKAFLGLMESVSSLRPWMAVWLLV